MLFSALAVIVFSLSSISSVEGKFGALTGTAAGKDPQQWVETIYNPAANITFPPGNIAYSNDKITRQ